MEIPADVAGDVLTLFVELDSGPLAGVLRGKEGVPLAR